ncbi:uncharacterized protein BDCG_07224 [Blastomyces dermatitidis ER-3]|uniref:Uncharacterized protein n=2 Tax=Ajellomyces dermatitidis TaxID=5039 RepID=F2T5V7_AJEDA|nr:uncharacterized protein BDCG_07224 [Blastomyces dermatitidis ER-3]EEQ92104.1 hypothetical protein BDCG_07224 [Blastomyces dermatitidis ER-3]EGE78620.1 hypothetical protein BDDG_01557 [Blastomyces dermatitidis ATCC 18188]
MTFRQQALDSEELYWVARLRHADTSLSLLNPYTWKLSQMDFWNEMLLTLDPGERLNDGAKLDQGLLDMGRLLRKDFLSYATSSRTPSRYGKRLMKTVRKTVLKMNAGSLDAN